MSTGDIVGILSLCITIAAIIFVIGKNAQRLEILEKDLNNVGQKITRYFSGLDKRVDAHEQMLATLKQQIRYLEERQFGEDTAARIRGE